MIRLGAMLRDFKTLVIGHYLVVDCHCLCFDCGCVVGKGEGVECSNSFEGL